MRIVAESELCQASSQTLASWLYRQLRIYREYLYNHFQKAVRQEMYLLMSPKTKIAITGDTDMFGTDKYNEVLSRNRQRTLSKRSSMFVANKIQAVIAAPVYKGAKLVRKALPRKNMILDTDAWM